MNKLVGLIYFYGHESIQGLAHATLLEITMREYYMKKIWEENS